MSEASFTICDKFGLLNEAYIIKSSHFRKFDLVENFQDLLPMPELGASQSHGSPSGGR